MDPTRRDATRACCQLASTLGLGSTFDDLAFARASSIARVPVVIWPVRANTTFGISFIGDANTPLEYGQYAAMSANVRLPMM